MRISDWSSDVCSSDLEVDRHRADDIAAALATVGGAPFTIRLSAAGVFDHRGRIDALWAGVTPHDELRALHKKIDRACQSAGTAPDQRAYLPHITLARLNRASGPVHDFLSLHAGLSSEPFVLDQFGRSEEHTYEHQSLMRISY